jgi:hypothetical protein
MPASLRVHRAPIPHSEIRIPYTFVLSVNWCSLPKLDHEA